MNTPATPESQPKALVYPELLDESKLDQLLMSLIRGINRELLYRDRSLIRVRNTLIAERVGKEVALNFEIYNLITEIVEKILNDRTVVGMLDMAAILNVLRTSSKDKYSYMDHLYALNDAATGLFKKNPGNEEAVLRLFSDKLREILRMPTIAQEMVVYPSAMRLYLGKTKSEVLQSLEKHRKRILLTLVGSEHEDINRIREEIESEYEAVKAWLEK